MNAMLFCVTVWPAHLGDSMAGEVAEVVQRLENARLHYEINGISTVVEGGWDEVMPVLRAAEAALRERYGRIFMLITIDDHSGRSGRLRSAIAEVEAHLEKPIPMS